MKIILCPSPDCVGHLIKTGVAYYTAPLQYELKCTCCAKTYKISESDLNDLNTKDT